MKDGAQVRIVLWLGLEKDQKEYCSGGEVVVLAETVSGILKFYPCESLCE